MNLQTFKTLFTQGKKGDTPVEGLCGRILRGHTDEDFITLTDDPVNRKIIMLMASDGLEQILGQSGYDSLITIGYEKEYIEYKLKEGCKFKLVVFNASDFKLATWDNVIDVVSSVYPDLEEKLRKQLEALKAVSFEKIQKMEDQTFKKIDRLKEFSEHYMSYDRFKRSKGYLHNVRAFLYSTIHLRELFAGDGYTYDEEGNRGLMEYITKNCSLDELGAHELINMQV